MKDADPTFLHEIVALSHREGALVIFDEMMTGFRYPGGSVQHAAGVRPDLTCLGKALSAGMPLSALVGRRDIFDSAIARIAYEPTFKGEAYSLAAAREALRIYKETGHSELESCESATRSGAASIICAATAAFRLKSSGRRSGCCWRSPSRTDAVAT